MKEYVLAWFFFPGIGNENQLELSDNEKVIAVLETVVDDPTNLESRRDVLCLVERVLRPEGTGIVHDPDIGKEGREEEG